MAHRWGYISHNPAEKVTMLKVQSEPPDALTDEELENLLSELPDAPHIIASVAVDTGMRRTELQELQWADVDFHKQSITVRKQKNYEFRVIPMTDRVYEILKDLKEKSLESKVKDLRVIPFVDIKKSLHSAGTRAGIGHVHLHMLRHTFATRLRDRGVPLDRIMELLGHKSMQMVLRYAKAHPQQLEEAIEALNQ